MSPYTICCTLCGWLVAADWDPDSSETWANQFRALYTGPEGLLLTGVALYDDPNTGVFAASLDRSTHWADPGYDKSAEVDFAVLAQPGPARPGFRGRHGFVFHDACWSLLEQASHPTPVSLERLLDVCSSLPVPRECRAPSWGHDFGGAAVVDNIHHFPWEDRYGDREFSDPDPVFSKNPYQAPVHHILTEDPEHPPAFSQTASSSETLRVGGVPLPEELCAAIAMRLPTADVLRARLALRAFWPVFYNQQFWKSRFQASTDRSWIFEARNGPPRDWRSLYRRTNDSRISPGLRNRRRIWGLLQGVLDILALVWNELPPALPEMWSPGMVPRATHRVEATGNLWADGQPVGRKFNNGCRKFRTQSIAVPETLARISVYTLGFGDAVYIVGMTLTAAGGETIRLGYRSPSEQSIELSQLWGFRLAMGSRGLQALQCITGPTGSEAPWLGSPDDVPRTERLVVTNCVVGLEVGFDGCKMVSIAVYIPSPPPPEVPRHRNRLRDSGVWYPTVPPRNLCLNEPSFLPIDFYADTGYRPLFWARFGGPGGKYLPNLTRISAAICVGILRIRFTFDKEVPVEHRSFGRLKDEEYEEVIDFSIDGPGGERIETINMRHYYPDPDEALPWMVQEGVMVRCKLYTNRGRSCLIFRSPNRRGKKATIHTKVTAAPGAAITGFYSTERPEVGHGITAMGIITEDVGDMET